MSAAEFDPEARAEFLAAVEYYEECQEGLGRRFRLTVESAVDHICEMPFRFRVLHAPFRRCLLPTFPYSVIFSIEPEFILVVAVAHAKRKPGYWHERIEKYR
ncbi:MAG: plasmid stabilization protein [Lentisphaerae bacterium RIFOXYB12_FULL_65_16]|nr:MAG: plasmid stabilization protein [Lentisphaerae bacterium RIFOXYA12_64_32]OGV90696.1 MAG: plasmid stabilization protein [Lentisphaerae bacterium RIFOXYB12_FULL_65_16]